MSAAAYTRYTCSVKKATFKVRGAAYTCWRLLYEDLRCMLENDGIFLLDIEFQYSETVLFRTFAYSLNFWITSWN